jgi:hypothetical protein
VRSSKASIACGLSTSPVKMGTLLSYQGSE